MFYKNSNSIGIRRKFDKAKTQVISFGGMRCEMSEKSQRKLADETLRKLDGGLSEKKALTWAKNQVKNHAGAW